MRTLSTASLLLASCLALPHAQAQTIERVKMTDNDLSCQQIYGEIGQMDGVIAKANLATGTAAPAATPGSDPSAQAAGAAVAGAVATQAIGQVAARTGFGGFGGFGGGGGLGGLFGNVAQAAANTAVQQQQAAAAQQQQAAAAQAQQSAMLQQQAQGRKEHLTSLFLSKGCKMSDIQK
jgi:hypothetical protein